MTTLADKIEALAKDATPGPWEACEPGDYGDFNGDSRVMCGDDKRIAVFHWNERYAEGNNADIELSVALRNNLPTILRALRERDQAVEALKRIAPGRMAGWKSGEVATEALASIEGTGHE